MNSLYNYNTILANTNNFYQTFSNSNLGLSTYTVVGLKVWHVIPNDLKRDEKFFSGWLLFGGGGSAYRFI